MSLLNAEFEGLVHIIVFHDPMPAYRRSLCARRLVDVRPYYWTEAWPTCLRCLRRADEDW